jgi:hypothetical protein
MYGQQQQTLGSLIRQYPEEALGDAQNKRLLTNNKQRVNGKYSGGSVVKVSVEVRNGAARFRVGVQASSIQRALNLVKGVHCASDVKVVFPIDPEGFFVEDALAAEGLIQRSNSQEEHREELAA